MKTFIGSHGSAMTGWLSSLRIPSRSQVVFSSLPLSLLDFVFKLSSSKLKKKLPLPLTLGPHKTVTKSRSMFPLPPLEERSKASMRSSHPHPLSWLAGPISKQLVPSARPMRLLNLSGVDICSLEGGRHFHRRQKLEEQQIGKIYYSDISTVSKSPHKCLTMVVWSSMLT